uniref:Uncharacterized protein n=1 Tax=Romanomermis culicivorax TaxID=13658 RepID=A0A915IBF3_ROMCU
MENLMRRMKVHIRRTTAVDVNLVDDWARTVDRFDFFWRHVFALGQFEDILFTVYNLQRAPRRPTPDVARMEPSIGVDGFGSFFRLLSWEYKG